MTKSGKMWHCSCVSGYLLHGFTAVGGKLGVADHGVCPCSEDGIRNIVKMPTAADQLKGSPH